MLNILVFARRSLHKVLTMLPFLGAGLTLALFLSVPSVSSAQAPLCQDLFDSPLALISMNPTYRGEEMGLYVDPVTKVPWKVRYFSEAEKAKYELFIRDGIFVDKDGVKAQSPFDHEAISWENGLLVIDAQSRIFLLPYEQRGLYHHSSLSAGKDVLFAGTAGFHQGYLREFSDRSGHYKPSTQQTRMTLEELSRKGVDLRQIRLTGHFIREITDSISISSREVPQVFPELFKPKNPL